MSDDKKSVKEFYDIDMEDIEEKAIKGNTYWANCITFYERVQNKSINSLTPGEAKWLSKIEEDLSL